MQGNTNRGKKNLFAGKVINITETSRRDSRIAEVKFSSRYNDTNDIFVCPTKDDVSVVYPSPPTQLRCGKIIFTMTI